VAVTEEKPDGIQLSWWTEICLAGALGATIIELAERLANQRNFFVTGSGFVLALTLVELGKRWLRTKSSRK
jgi:high-affinity Fe2+/Pb2+ permease